MLEELGFVGWGSIEPQILTALYIKHPLLLIGNHGCNKAQPLHCKIKVPNGWTAMGAIRIGDTVCTPDGKTALVVGVYPQGMRDVYRVTFEDGRTTECSADHLWRVYSYGWRRNPWRVMSLREVMEHKNKRGLFIPLPSSVYGEEKNLPLDPYILGLLLGDGGFSQLNGGVTFSCHNEETLKRLQQGLQWGYTLIASSKGGKGDYIITHKNNKGSGRKGVYSNLYKKVLKDLGLLGCNSYTKFIPEIYKEASMEQRLELLRGLMDTDGWGQSGAEGFSSSSHKLALDVQYLIRSLGGLCSITPKRTFYIYKGVKREGKTSFSCQIRHETPEIFFKDLAKREQARRSRQIILKNKIKSIKYLGKMECQCIRIDHSDHLYITDNFVVTHNTDGAERLAKLVLGEDAQFAAYDSPWIQFDDLCGLVNPNTFTSGGKSIRSAEAFVHTPLSIWDKDAILLDELTGANPFLQSQLHELVRKRTIMGIPTKIQYVFAAANPPTTYDTMHVPLPLASRFAIVEIPSTKTMSTKALSKLLSLPKMAENTPTLKTVFEKADKLTAHLDDAKVVNLILDIVNKLKAGGHAVNLEGRTLRLMQDLVHAFCRLKDGNPGLKFKTAIDLPEVLLSVIPEVSAVVNCGVNRATILAILKDAVTNFDTNTYALDFIGYIRAGENVDPMVFHAECLSRIESETNLGTLMEALNLIQNVPGISTQTVDSITAAIQVKRFLLSEVDDRMTIDELHTKIMES